MAIQKRAALALKYLTMNADIKKVENQSIATKNSNKVIYLVLLFLVRFEIIESFGLYTCYAHL